MSRCKHCSTAAKGPRSQPVSSPNSYVEILTPKDDSIRSWGLWEVLRSHEGGALVNGISVLIKDPRAPSPLPPHEDTRRRGCLQAG